MAEMGRGESGVLRSGTAFVLFRTNERGFRSHANHRNRVFCPMESCDLIRTGAKHFHFHISIESAPFAKLKPPC